MKKFQKRVVGYRRACPERGGSIVIQLLGWDVWRAGSRGNRLEFPNIYYIEVPGSREAMACTEKVA